MPAFQPAVFSQKRPSGCPPPIGTTPQPHNPEPVCTSPGYRDGLFPVHSPLLGESLLVSFPPLTNMLKFSGSAYLI